MASREDSKRQALEAKAVDFTSEAGFGRRAAGASHASQVCTETRTFAKLPECETTLQNPLTSVAHRARAREADLPGLEIVVNRRRREHVRPLKCTISVDFVVCSLSRAMTLGGVVLEEDKVCPQATRVASFALSQWLSCIWGHAPSYVV